MERADNEALWAFILPYFSSTQEFEVRFAIVTAMTYLLKEMWLERVFEQLDSIDFNRIRSRYRSEKGKPKVAQQGTVQGAEPY